MAQILMIQMMEDWGDIDTAEIPISIAGVATFLTVGGGLFLGLMLTAGGIGSFGALSVLSGLAIGIALLVQQATCHSRWMTFQDDLLRLVKDTQSDITKSNVTN